MAVLVTLVKALGIGPSGRHGSAHDLTWGPHEGWWAATFGGDGGLFGDGGGGGDGGGDGGGGGGNGGGSGG
jgi:hypothetical protein